jgi:hypothetical protein
MFNVLAVSTIFRTSGGARHQNLEGHLRVKFIFLGGGKIEFLKGDEYPRNIAPLRIFAPHICDVVNSAKLKLFCLF